MIVLVCGSRSWTDKSVVWATLNSKLASIHRIIQGDCRGPDLFAREWAIAQSIPVESYPAKWKEYGRSAGFKRNQQMLDEGKPDLVIAYWDGVSRGTEHMLTIAKKAGVKVIAICTCGREYDFERPDTHASQWHQ